MPRPLSITVVVAAVLLGLAACTTAPAGDAKPASAESTPAASASTTPKPTPSAIPDADFEGDWAGRAQQNDATHDVELSLLKTAGGYAGTIRHAELECSGTLGDGTVSAGVLTIQKHIDVNGNCIVDLEVTLTLIDADTLRYDTDVSTAVLTRTDLG